MKRSLLILGSLSLVLFAACTPVQEQAIKDIMDDGGGCITGGCSGQLCIEEGDDGVSTCEWREEYTCYKTATCERQDDGQCGWTQTEELTSCLQNPPSMIEDGESVSSDTMMKDDSVMIDDKAMIQSAVYTAYDSSVLMNGETKVLFFHAAWCPVCRAADVDLQEWFAQNLPTLNVYKVDYDTSTDLKSKYGVTYQHTFVLVDGQGNALKTIQGPSDEALKDLIGAKS
jgi:thioredoxin 1